MATKWAICSAGHISEDFTSAIQTLPAEEHQVVAVATRNDLARAKSFAEKFKIKNSFGSYEELAAFPDVDVVYIGTINPHHYAVCKMMITAGKNVVCEKPMCLSAKHCENLISLAKQHNVFFMEAFWSRFFPAYQHIRSEIAAGSNTIGEPLYAYLPFCVSVAQKARVAEKSLGGGVTLDIGCYGVQLALWIFQSKPISVKASGRLNSEGVDEVATITLEFSDNRVATIHASGLFRGDNTAIINGTKGYLKLGPFMHSPTSVTSAEGTIDFPLPPTSVTPKFNNGQGMVYEVKCIRECLLKGKKECATIPLAESLEIAKILDEVLKQLGVTFDIE